MSLLGESAGKRAWRDLNKVSDHLNVGRIEQAKPVIERLYSEASEVIEVLELYALTIYHLGRWEDAIEALEELRVLTGLPDQNPVLADAHRALGHWEDVEVLWTEVSEYSPASDVVTEARIVAASALADQGRLREAVTLLGAGWKRPKRPYEHHLRRGYVLAELYERAGETPKARELFRWVAHHEPSFHDAAERSG